MLVLPCGDAIDRVQFIKRSGWTGAEADAMNVVATGNVAIGSVAIGYPGGPIGLGTTLFGESP